MNSLNKAQEFICNISCKHEVLPYLAKSHNNIAWTSLVNELLLYYLLIMYYLLLTANRFNHEVKHLFRIDLDILLFILKYTEISDVRSSNLGI